MTYRSRELASRMGRTHLRRSVWLLAGLMMLPLLGCGESQEDLMMRAARRKRASNETENAAKKKDGNPKPVASDARMATTNVASPLVPERERPANQPKDPADGEKAKKVELAIKPIEERKPETPLTTEARRKRAFENIDKIGQALIKYHDDKRIFPRSYSKSASGILTLSWRVELLPYLGYEDLYKKFDWNVPWNREPNKSLLQYIPDEYVSPERFDTNTNYQVPAHRKFMFADNKARAQINIEDGSDNTIMLLEVNDELAVPWTKPGDYVPRDIGNYGNDLGALRKDGTFAVWANGWTVLLAKELSGTQILNALTYESGDGQLAGAIHRDIPIGGVSDPSVAAVKRTEVPVDKPGGRKMIPRPKETVRVRTPVPKAAEVAEAKEKLRTVYSDRIRDAKDDKAKTKLATDMLADALAMEGDHSGAFALQSAAMRLAVDGGSPDTLIAAIDQRVGKFDVDAYQENITRLLEFGQNVTGRDPATVNSGVLLDRCTRVIFAAVDDNDFIRASAVARIAYRFTGQERHEVIPKLLNRLRLLLSTANREYESAADDLRSYREDPEDVEAAASFGRFLCFIKGDWETGLPLLTKGGPAQLREVAELDLAGAPTSDQQIALGDAWWELSELARAGVYRQAARDRAVYWYAIAFSTLPDSLNRMHVKNRIDEARAIDGTSPIAICIQLADELGVDLEVGLAGIADVGQGRPGTVNRGGRSEYD